LVDHFGHLTKFYKRLEGNHITPIPNLRPHKSLDLTLPSSSAFDKLSFPSYQQLKNLPSSLRVRSKVSFASNWRTYCNLSTVATGKQVREALSKSGPQVHMITAERNIERNVDRRSGSTPSSPNRRLDSVCISMEESHGHGRTPCAYGGVSGVTFRVIAHSSASESSSAFLFPAS